MAGQWQLVYTRAVNFFGQRFNSFTNGGFKGRPEARCLDHAQS